MHIFFRFSSSKAQLWSVWSERGDCLKFYAITVPN